jgi:hypothetical protein
MANVTLAVDSVKSGDLEASAQRLPLIFCELRHLAVHRLAREAPGQFCISRGERRLARPFGDGQRQRGSLSAANP